MSINNGKDYLLLVWKADVTRRQYVVGQLSKNGRYEFNYSEEVELAIEEGFSPLVSFPNIHEKYYSEELFPVFAARLPDRKRRDIVQILDKYGLKEYDAYQLLKKSGAKLPIDRLQFIDPIFDMVNNEKRSFYLAGPRHYLGCANNRCDNAVEVVRGDEVFLEQEPNNLQDKYAIKVLNYEKQLLGYIPRYYSEFFSKAISEQREVMCFVSAVNKNQCCDECIELTISIK